MPMLFINSKVLIVLSNFKSLLQDDNKRKRIRKDLVFILHSFELSSYLN